MTDQVDDAGLDLRQLPRRTDRVDCVGESFESVADRDQDVRDATVFDLGEYPQLELRAITPVAGPDAEDVAFSRGARADDDVERLVNNLPVADLHHEGVDEDHRIDAIERTGLLLGHLLDHLLEHLVGDPADRVLADLSVVDIYEMRRDLPRREPAGSQRQHDLVDPVEPALALLHDLADGLVGRVSTRFCNGKTRSVTGAGRPAEWGASPDQPKMLTPPGPTSRPTTIKTAPHSICLRRMARMPATTSTTAMIQSTVAMISPSLGASTEVGGCIRTLDLFLLVFSGRAPRTDEDPAVDGRAIPVDDEGLLHELVTVRLGRLGGG